ncbi:hypothetical protein ABT247_00445 [Kitasatospora sp. NPDC001539]|uniref:hypothetical protein n=1 Tax=Kitasatospora sp. NPDC001539 TaxID=3154384 RepID=UPI0033301733
MPFPPYTTRRPGLDLLRWLTVAGLAVDAYVHADLADRYDPVANPISQGDLFRAEAGLAALAALLVLIRPRLSALAFAFLVAAGGLVLLLLYRYVDVGSIGPLPDMYEPVWFTEKVVAAVAQGVAAVAVVPLLRAHRRVLV